ncbi:flagellar basal-body rod protein FlgB [Paenibacillus uliginis N3/975]|uniref:Flagellar basal body rod protein FlgB n=1 Tax=Paenibacillus uliginis N3/975 TaxID=1313296 RepID=A0A1X7H9F6_9BACL|nr:MULTISPECIES: flagellar basal body rod protein FlgB [Paenibacillus]UNK16715.1 flagellar basal body rod protein FlgB [Paenibacillus sp. N3/727]SMF81508.1 flagellar basal-body rod protein FlgB [Paenibacillus uliginis N3/975]
MNLLSNSSFQRLQSGLDAANLRNQVLANNIANVDTPYFKRSDVAFESLLQKEMNGVKSTLSGKRTDPKHFIIGPSSQIPEISVKTDDSSAMNNNGNNVDVEREMSLLAENQLRYNSYIQSVNEQIRIMRTVIEGR